MYFGRIDFCRSKILRISKTCIGRGRIVRSVQYWRSLFAISIFSGSTQSPTSFPEPEHLKKRRGRERVQFKHLEILSKYLLTKQLLSNLSVSALLTIHTRSFPLRPLHPWIIRMKLLKFWSGWSEEVETSRQGYWSALGALVLTVRCEHLSSSWSQELQTRPSELGVLLHPL